MTAIGGHVFAYKGADQSKTSDAALGDDSSLSFLVGAGEKWWFKVLAFVVTADANPDIQVAMNGPAINDIRYHAHVSDHTKAVGDTEAIITAWDATLALNWNGAANDDITCEGGFETSASGTVVFRWAQRVSDVAVTTIKRGSTIIAKRLE